MTGLQPHKAAIAADLNSGNFEAARKRALALYPSNRVALERAYQHNDIDLFREICGIDVEFETPYTIQPRPVSHQQPINYAPLVKGVAVLGGVAVFGSVVVKVCAVILTGAMVGLSAAVATVTEYALYIGGTIIAVWLMGVWLSNRNDAEVKTKTGHDGINVVVNIHSNNEYTQSSK